MVDEQDYSFDQMSAGMDKVIEKLKQAEKLFDNMLKTAQKLNKTKMSGVGTGASGNTGGSGTGNKSGAGSSTWDNYEKQTREAIKQMQEMASIRADLIMLDYDELEARQKVQGERVKENILLRRDNNMMVEEEKTKRAKLKIFSKMLGQTGGAGGLLSLGGIMSMGAGGVGMAGSEGGESVGQKIGDKAKDRILNYQKNIRGNNSSTDNPSKGSKTYETLTKKFPKLASGIFGSKGEDGTLKGGLLGKAGKIAGKGGALGGMAGGGAGGLIGGMIMKGLESSPMFQAVSKIMNQAFGLYLRPIGDFVGAFFMPIAKVMMLEGAINLKKSKQFISMGDQLGKLTVAFFRDPAAVIRASFQSTPLLSVYGNDSKDKNPNGIIEGIGDKIYATELGKIMERLNGSSGANGVNNGMVVNSPDQEIKSGLTSQLLDQGIEWQKQQHTDLENLIPKAGDASDKMGSIKQHIQEAMKNPLILETFKKQEGTKWAQSEAGQATGLFDEQGSLIKDEMDKYGVILTEAAVKQAEIVAKAEATTVNQYMKTEKYRDEKDRIEKMRDKKDFVNKQDISKMTVNTAVMFEEAQKTIQQRLAALIRTQIVARTTHGKDGKIGKADSDLLRTQALLAAAPKDINYSATEAAILSGSMAGTHGAVGMNNETLYRKELQSAQKLGVGINDYYKIEKIMTTYGLTDWNVGRAINKSMNKLTSQSMRYEGGSVTKDQSARHGIADERSADWYDASQGWKLKTGTYGQQVRYQDFSEKAIYDKLTTEQKAARYYSQGTAIGMANGGIINEPIFGIGKSGQQYLFGERGSEKVTPMNGSSGGNVIVNINIAKVSSDVDLNLIKPIVERALLETHARRGII